MKDDAEPTLLEFLAESLKASDRDSRAAMVAPAAILWPDEVRQWEPLIPLLRNLLPSLVQLGPYDPNSRSGPAVWLRCLLAGELDASDWFKGDVPIIYLPGVGRHSLRAVEDCPKDLQPLAELQYRGVLWTNDGSDWTPMTYLRSKEGLGLDVATDKGTGEAMLRALLTLADTRIDTLRGRRLEASDFDQLLSPDPARDLLRWMSDPELTRGRWGTEHWAAFRSICKSTYGFDPEAAGALGAAETMAHRSGAWERVWQHFVDAPRSYPGVQALLEQAHPLTLEFDPLVWPGDNELAEADLRGSLLALESVAPGDAADTLLELENEHGMRRRSVWADLGRAPLAWALEHLSVVGGRARKALGGATPDEMASLYRRDGWQVDSAALEALDAVVSAEDVAAVRAALCAVYRPWLEDAASRLQALSQQFGYPGSRADAFAPIVASDGQCLIFVDGLRFDVGERLKGNLTMRGRAVTREERWAAMPSVTPTCKPAVSPVTESIVGLDFNENFQPSDAIEDKPLSIDRFRKLLVSAGYQVLRGDDLGDPRGRAWTENGELDHMGHEQGWKLARRIDEVIRELTERIETLLDAGWKSVKIVTDHGWLLLPGGLPKVELPGFLADTRWGRCAVLKTSAKGDGLLVVDWRWSKTVRIALAPGIGSYIAGKEYAHGGLSLQECLTPVLTISHGQENVNLKIDEVNWQGLRCRVSVSGTISGRRLDIRTKPNDQSTSVVNSPRDIEYGGRTSLVVPDDSLLGTAAYLVVVDESGAVTARLLTCIGGDD